MPTLTLDDSSTIMYYDGNTYLRTQWPTIPAPQTIITNSTHQCQWCRLLRAALAAKGATTSHNAIVISIAIG
jgi:hypothetical protein